MTADTVDDLHAAEDAAGTLAEVLRNIAALSANRTIREAALGAAATWEGYCRGSCGAEGEALQEQCEDDSCGCPCGHVDKWEALPERDRRQYGYRREYEDRGHAEGFLDGCTNGDRYLLIEENVRGGYWLTTFNTAEDALVYHREQEYASEWTASCELVDLDENLGLDLEESKVTRQWTRRAS